MAILMVIQMFYLNFALGMRVPNGDWMIGPVAILQVITEYIKLYWNIIKIYSVHMFNK